MLLSLRTENVELYYGNLSWRIELQKSENEASCTITPSAIIEIEITHLDWSQ